MMYDCLMAHNKVSPKIPIVSSFECSYHAIACFEGLYRLLHMYLVNEVFQCNKYTLHCKLGYFLYK